MANTTNTVNSINFEKTEIFQTDDVNKKDFAKFVRDKCKELNEDQGKDISTRKLSELFNINHEMFRKILNGNKPTKKRDFIIAVCIALECLQGEIDDCLRLYGMPPINENDSRDVFIINQIKIDEILTVEELNNRLIERGFQALDIHTYRKVAKKAKNRKTPSSYSVLEIKTRTTIDNLYYLNPYDSLGSMYNPKDYICLGKMLLKRNKDNCAILLSASSDGYLSMQKVNVDDFPELFKTLDETREYRTFFTELLGAIDEERHKLLSVLDDTKNYKKRSSARFIDGSVVLYEEEYNYTLPEMEEYYLMEYSKGMYQLSVYNTSAFMHAHLSKDIFKKEYGEWKHTPKEVYFSEDEIKELLANKKIPYEKSLILRMRIAAFRNMKKDIIRLLDNLKQRRNFINNPNNYDHEDEICRYYDVFDVYKCEEDEMGFIKRNAEIASFDIGNNKVITLSFKELCRAFELGIPTIEDICKVKSNLGDIESVLY